MVSVFNPCKCTHTWSSGHARTHTHTHTWSSGHTHTHTHTHLEQWTCTHTHTHTHTEQWAADTAASGEQLGVRCLAQGSHLSRGQFLPEQRFEPTTSGYKSDALSIRATTAPCQDCFWLEELSVLQLPPVSVHLYKCTFFTLFIIM